MSMKKRLLALLLALCLTVTLMPGAALASGTPFQDVKSGQWYSDAVNYVYNNGLMSGTGKTSFGLNTPTNRGMIVQILYSMEDKPEVSSGESFSDVYTRDYYYNAVRWASSQGIVTGTGKGRFTPNAPVSRESLALILYNFARYKEYDTSIPSGVDLRAYSDYSRINSWSMNAVAWANGKGLLSGKPGNKIDPQGNATRAEVAAILYSFCEKVADAPDDVIYTVTFNHNYTGGASPVQQVQAGQTVTEPVQPVRPGYTFDGWFTQPTGGTAFSFDTAITGNTTLYAHWTEDGGSGTETPPPPTGNVTVRFDYNYEGAPAGQSILVPVGNKVESIAAPTREGFTFTGWYTQPAGGELYSFDTAVTGDLTLYAQWSGASTVQVAFNLNYEGALPMDPVNVASGQMCPAPSFTPLREDYQFDGWFTSPDDQGVKFEFATTPVTDTITLYAHWTYTGPNWATPYQVSGYITQYDGTDPVKNNFQMMGLTYTQGLRWEATYSSADTEASFNLQGKYEVMTFDVGHVDNGRRREAKLYFYFDGGATPAAELELTGTMSTEHIVLNVKNRTNLRIVRKGGDGYHYATANMLLLTTAEAQGANIVVPATISAETVKQTNLASGTIMPYQNSGYIETYDGSNPLKNFKMTGIDYTQGVRFEATYSSDNTDVLYNLGCGFDMVSFKVGHVDNGGRRDAEIRVYGDDELLDTIKLTGIMATTTYSISTKGINKLRLVRAGGDGYHYAIADVTAYTTADLAGNNISAPALSSYAEVNVTNLAAGLVMPYQASGYIDLYDGTSQDPNRKFTMTGVDFRQGIRFEATYSSDDTDVSFNLGKGFTTMTFTVGHVDNGRTANASLLIYKDGVLDESQTIALTGNMPNAPITLDVSGVNNLRIVRRGRDGYHYGMANVTLS